jgi:hypothetical protein
MDWAGTLVSSRYDAIGQLAAEVVQTGPASGPPERPDRRRRHPSGLGLARPGR